MRDGAPMTTLTTVARCLAGGLAAVLVATTRVPAPAAVSSPAIVASTSTGTAVVISTTNTSTATTTAAISATSTATTAATSTATGVPSGAIVIDPPVFPTTVGDGRHPVIGVALVHNDADKVYKIGEVYMTADKGLAFGLARDAFAGCPDLTIAPGGACAVTLIFVPPAPGQYTARVGVSGLLAGRYVSADAPLLGLATAPETPTATISPTPIAVPISAPTGTPTATSLAVPPTEPPHPTPLAVPTATNTATPTPPAVATATLTATSTTVATATPTIMATPTAVHGSARLAPVAIWLVAGVGHTRWRDAPFAEGPPGQRITVVIAAGAGARVWVDVRTYDAGRGVGHSLTLYHHVEVARADTAGRVRVTLPLPIRRGERVRVGALDLDALTWRCVRTPRLVACSPSRPRAGTPATSGRADDGRSLL